MKKFFIYNLVSRKNLQKRDSLFIGRRFVFVESKDDDGDSQPPEGPPSSEAPETAPKTPEEESATPEGVKQTPETAGQNMEVGQSDEIPELQSKFSLMLNKALETSEKAQEALSRKKGKERNEALIEKFTSIHNTIGALAEIDKKSRLKTKKVLRELIREGKITTEEATEILDLHVANPEYEEKWTEFTKKIEGPENSDAIAVIKAESHQSGKLEEDFGKNMEELSSALSEAGDYLYHEAHKDRWKKQFSQHVGFELEEGKVLRFKYYRQVKKTAEPGKKPVFVKEPVYRTATIKKVDFDDVEIRDKSGRVRTVPSMTPSIVLKYEDEWADEYGELHGGMEKISAQALRTMVDRQEMVELIEDRQETDDTEKEINQLEAIIGMKINEGDTFEYRELAKRDPKDFSEHTKTEADRYVGKNKSVYITSIRKVEDEFFNGENSQRKGMKTTVIDLSEPVVVASNPKLVEKKTLTLGEFARWRKRVDAMKPISFDELRKQLKEEFKERNASYKRKSDQYPPIEVENGEILYFDTEPKSTFVITDVDEEKGQILLDNGAVFTAATFLAWVKSHEVEKKTGESEAHKQTDNIEDPVERQAAFDEAKDKAESQLEERRVQKGNADDENLIPAPSSSFLRQVWNDSYFLSLGDMYAMGKEIYDYIVRTMDRRQKNRIGEVGHAGISHFYGKLGAEFKAIQQGAENDEVQRFTKTYEQYGYGDLYDRLKVTTNRDELKAILTVMSGKGWIKWDDPILLATLNRIAQSFDASLKITEYDEGQIAAVLDAFWGDNNFIDFRSKNESSYESKKNSERDSAMRLENDPSQKGGMKGRLQNLIEKHLAGEFVDPAQYEGFIYFALEAGKLTFADKMYFILMGLGAEGPPHGKFPGRTILDFGRVSDFGTKLLGNYPIIDYLTTSRAPKLDSKGREITDENGNVIEEQLDKNFIKNIIRNYIVPDVGGKSIHNIKASEHEAGDNLTRFIERKILPHPVVQTRLADKSSRDVSKWDHDDFHMNAPQLGERQIELLTNMAGGNQGASTQGIRNALSGLNHFTNIYLDEVQQAAKSGDKNGIESNITRATDTLLSFVRLNAILDDRYYHGIHDRTRLSTELKQFSGVDTSRYVSTQVDEMNMFISGLIGKMLEVDRKKYKNLSETWEMVRNPVPYSKRHEQKEAADKFGVLLKDGIRTLIDNDNVGYNGFVQKVFEVQGKGSSSTQLVKGIQQRTKDKNEIAALEEGLFRCDPIDLPEVKSDVAQIVDLQLRAMTASEKSNEEIADEKSAKLEDIISRVKRGDYSSITSSDKKRLTEELSRLKRVVGEPEDSVAPVDDESITHGSS